MRKVLGSIPNVSIGSDEPLFVVSYDTVRPRLSELNTNAGNVSAGDFVTGLDVHADAGHVAFSSETF